MNSASYFPLKGRGSHFPALKPLPKSGSFCVSPLPGITMERPRKQGHAKRAGFRKWGHAKRAGFRKQEHPKIAGFQMKNCLQFFFFFIKNYFF